MLAVLQARMSSTRLPGKVMRPLLGVPMISHQIERLRRARRLDDIVVATSTDASDDPLADYLKSTGVAVFRGDLNDVLGRFHGAIEAMGRPDTFLRLTADCPLADPDVVDLCIDTHLKGAFDCTYSSADWTFPKGLDVEVVQTRAFDQVFAEAQSAYDREHVTPFLYSHPERFSLGTVQHDPPERWRWTVDEPADLAFVTEVYEALYPQKPDFRMADILAWQTAHPGKAIPNVIPA
jgi:spore coat polysaccharide biosynthesis protein SpsF